MVEEVLASQGGNIPFGIINSILNTALADEAKNSKRPKYTRWDSRRKSKANEGKKADGQRSKL